MSEVRLETKTGVILEIGHSMHDFDYEMKVRFPDKTAAYMKLSRMELISLENQLYEMVRVARTQK